MSAAPRASPRRSSSLPSFPALSNIRRRFAATMEHDITKDHICQRFSLFF
jgi:hypothetical protein